LVPAHLVRLEVEVQLARLTHDVDPQQVTLGQVARMRRGTGQGSDRATVVRDHRCVVDLDPRALQGVGQGEDLPRAQARQVQTDTQRVTELSLCVAAP
jgi:hypothetical protein